MSCELPTRMFRWHPIALAAVVAVLLPLAAIAQHAVQPSAIAQAQAFFPHVIALEAAYDATFVNFLADDAVVRNYKMVPDGNVRDRVHPVPFLRPSMPLGMLISRDLGRRLTYSDCRARVEGARVRISCTQERNEPAFRGPFSMLVGPDSAGAWKIYEHIAEPSP